MIRLLLGVAFTWLTFAADAQITLLTTDFEGAGNPWTFSGSTAPLHWVTGDCAGNGASMTGTHALYISPGGAGIGCGPTGATQFSYVNAPSGNLELIAATAVDAVCASALQVTFNYRIDGNATDFATLVYSTDNGVSWNIVSNLTSSASWTTASFSLPAALNFTNFQLGFRFAYDDAVITGSPIAVDNLVITGTDTQAPSITCLPTQNEQVDAACGATLADYTKLYAALSDNCTDSADIVVTQAPAIGTFVPNASGTNVTVVLTATDESGNSSTCSFAVHFADGIQPTVNCPPNTVAYVNSACSVQFADYRSLATGLDNCTAAGSLVFAQNPPAGTALSGANLVTIVTLTATDASGNSGGCTFTVTSTDTISPAITCPATQAIYAATNCTANLGDYKALAVFTDNCQSGTLSVTQVPAPGMLISADQPVTLTVSGGTPNRSASCVFTVSLIDTMKPQLTCPLSPVIYANANCEVSLADYTTSLAWSDNCTSAASNMTFSQMPAPGTLVNASTATVLMTAADAAGNMRSCSFNLQFSDTIQPLITCSTGLIGYASAGCSFTVPDFESQTTFTDNCTATSNLIYTQSPAANAAISQTTTLTITVADAAGNQGYCHFPITLIDTVKPAITCPATQTVSTTSGCTLNLANYTGLAAATDNCTIASSLVFTQSPAVGTVVATGNQLVTLTVADATNNHRSCSFNLLIEDPDAPVISICPGTQSAMLDANCSAVLGSYGSFVTATDNCTPANDLVFVQTPAAGTFITANSTVTITVTDLSGNSAACSFTAQLTDTIRPSVTCAAQQEAAINSSCQYTIPDFAGTFVATDNCTTFAQLTFTQDPLPGTPGTGITNVVLTLTDASGNARTCTTLVIPADDEVPEITCPSDMTVDNGSNCAYTVANLAATALVSDNCTNYTLVQQPAIGTTLQSGQHPVLLTVTDAGGNTASCSFSLTITENVAPLITCPSTISGCDPVVTFSQPVATDNCTAYVVQTDLSGLSSGDVFPVGTTVLEFTAYDSTGNSNTCSFSIQVLDFPAPAVIAADTVELCGATSYMLSADPIASGNGLWTQIQGNGAMFNNPMASATGVNNLTPGVHAFTWTVTSASCGSTADTIVLVIDQQPLPASTQDTSYACAAVSVVLQGNPPNVGQGLWSTVQGGTIANPGQPNTTASGLLPGWNDFVWTISNGSCPSSSDTVSIYHNNPAVITTADTSLCFEHAYLVALSAAAATGQQSRWYFIHGQGEVQLPDAANTPVSGIGSGENLLIYRLYHPSCGYSYDTLRISVAPCAAFELVIPTIITPNQDGKNDLLQIDYLHELYPDAQVLIINRWGMTVYESTGYANPWDGTFKGEHLPFGTYFYKIQLQDPGAREYSGSVTIIR
jgi:gliding motility-associated-like protein